jgi:glycosyltransferase involved in cell wall biosynthesis
MKILVLTSTYSRRKDDTEPKFVDNLCQQLARGNEVHVIAPHAPGIPREETMDGIPVFRFQYCFEAWQTLAYDGGILPSLKQNRLRVLLIPLFLISQLLLTIKLLRRHQYDVVHAHWIIPQGLVAVVARPFARSPFALVMTSHGGDLFALQGNLLARLKKWITARADHLTVVSSAMKARAADLALKDETQISDIPMGVDAHSMFCPPSPGAPRQGLLFVGRLVDKKGVEHLIAAMPRVLQAHPEQHLTIVGDGPLLETLRALCASHGVTEHVTFTGAVTNRDIPGFLQRSAVTIFPSIVTDSGDQEGTPVAVMEALACECATIVSDYPGARDIIQDGENGLLVAQKAPGQIAAAINNFLASPEKRSSMGAAGRQTVQRKYDWRVISAEFLALFQALRAKA